VKTYNNDNNKTILYWINIKGIVGEIFFQRADGQCKSVKKFYPIPPLLISGEVINQKRLGSVKDYPTKNRIF